MGDVHPATGHIGEGDVPGNHDLLSGSGNPPEPQEIAIEDGKMEGDKLTFTINRSMGERTFSMTFTGTVSGATMEGTMATSGGMGGGEPVPFKGVKKEG